MSLVFEPPWTRKGAPPQVSTVQRLLDENNQLIIKIRDLQNQGAPDRAEAFQKKLHRNLIFLAKAADKFHNSYKEQQEQPQQEQESLEQHKLEKTPVPPTDMVYEEVDRTADPNL